MEGAPHWDHDDSRHIIEEVEKLVKDGLSARKAADQVQLNHLEHSAEDIRSKYKRYLRNGGRSHGNQIFTDSQIEEIIGCLQAWSLANRGLCKSFVVEHLGRMRGVEGWNARSWLDELIASHSDRLKLIPTVSIDPSRVTNEVKEQTELFLAFLPSFLKSKGIPNHMIYNADETRVKLEGKHANLKLIESCEKKAHEHLAPILGKAASYAAIVSTTGEILFSVYVLPLKNDSTASIPLRVAQRLNTHDYHDHPVYYAFTKSGWFNAEVWVDVLKVMRTRLDVVHPGLHAILMMDSLSCHLTYEVLACGSNNNIHQVFFPRHATHFIQPEDNLVYATFKKMVYKHVVKLITGMRLNHRDLGTMLVEAAHEAETSITKGVIIESWKNCGLFPWSPELIRVNMGNTNPTAAPSEIKVGDMAKSLTGSMLSDFFGPGEESIAEVNPTRRNRGRNIFSGGEVLKMIQEEEDEKKEKAALMQETKVNKQKEKEAVQSIRETATRDYSCRGSNHDGGVRPVWKGSDKWLWCSFCEEFGICPKCLKSDREMLTEHEERHNDGMNE
jgi:hypothetical protein